MNLSLRILKFRSGSKACPQIAVCERICQGEAIIFWSRHIFEDKELSWSAEKIGDNPSVISVITTAALRKVSAMQETTQDWHPFLTNIQLLDILRPDTEVM